MKKKQKELLIATSQDFLKKHKFLIIFSVILLASFILRFYNLPDRWIIGNDNTRDMAIAKEALHRHELPLIGSFSSAGPFVFGPLFYWIIMTSYLFLPFLLTAPVIITAFTGVITVAILMYCGYLLEGKRLAIIIGILSATAPQLVIRSIVVGQHTYVAIATSFLILTFILFWKRINLIYAFLMGVSLGAAISFHYQSLNLLIFFFAILFLPRLSIFKKLLGLLLIFIGFIIPSLPLIIWDSQQHWANIRNILDYFLIAQYRLYVPNSWKLFIFKYLTSYWAYVLSGSNIIALCLMIFSFIVVGLSVFKKKISWIVFVLFVIFAVFLFINRFYKGERSEGYLIYLSPFVLLFTAWSINKLFELRIRRVYSLISKILGIVIISIIFAGNMWQAIHYEKTINNKSELESIVNFLIKKYPDTNFAIYDFHNRSGDMSQPLSLFLKNLDNTDPHGMPLGMVCQSSECPQNFPLITTLGYNYIVDIRKVANRDNRSSGWVKVNQEAMYDDLVGWSKRHELISTFSFWSFVSSKFKN